MKCTINQTLDQRIVELVVIKDLTEKELEKLIRLKIENEIPMKVS